MKKLIIIVFICLIYANINLAISNDELIGYWNGNINIGADDSPVQLVINEDKSITFSNSVGLGKGEYITSYDLTDKGLKFIIRNSNDGFSDGTYNFDLKDNKLILTLFRGDNVDIMSNKKPETVTKTVKSIILTKLVDTGIKFSGMNGQVEILIPGSNEWEFADLNSNLPAGTRIKVEESSSAILSFTDMSTFVIKGGTEIIIATPPNKNTKVKLVKGDIWANVKKMILNGTMDIEMNQAVAGIKGTTLILKETGNESTLKVIEGSVDFTNKFDKSTINVKSGEQIFVKENKTSEIINFDIIEENKKWEIPDSKKEESSYNNKDSNNNYNTYIITSIIFLILGTIIFIKYKK